MNQYATAAICLNGHLITNNYENDNTKNFCTDCGKEVITTCPNCSKQILGKRIYSRMIIPPPVHYIPLYCHNCGVAYPWTETALNSAKELIFEDTLLNNDDKNSLICALSDLTVESPKTQVAISNYKSIVSKAAKTTADCLKGIFIEIVSETIKRQLWG